MKITRTKARKGNRSTSHSGDNGFRPDGFLPLPWYETFKFLATDANNGSGWDVALTGPASSGKTTAGYMLAHDLGYEIIVQQCHRRVEVEDFRGTRSIVPGKGNVPVTGFDPGTLTQAVTRATDYQNSSRAPHGIVYLVDEANLVDPAMLAILNNLTQKDKHSGLSVPETQSFYPRPPNLIIVFTLNPEYLGTQQLSEAFTSRVVKLECPMMDLATVRKIMDNRFPKFPDHCLAASRIMGYIESCRKQETHQWEADLRTMFQFLDIWIKEDPSWHRGVPGTSAVSVLDRIIGPKIGWMDSIASVRKGLCDAILSTINTKFNDDDNPTLDGDDDPDNLLDDDDDDTII